MAAAPTSIVSTNSEDNMIIDIDSIEKKKSKNTKRNEKKAARKRKKLAKNDPLEGHTFQEYIVILSDNEPIVAHIINLFYYYYNNKTTFKKIEKDKLGVCKIVVKKELVKNTKVSKSLSTYSKLPKTAKEYYDTKYMDKAILKIIDIKEFRDDLFN